MFEEMKAKDSRTYQGMTPMTYALTYSPLVMALARRYKGRGVDYDDLVEDGYVSLLKLVKQCPDDPLGKYISRRLPGMVRDAAARYRKSIMSECSIEAAEEAGIEQRDPMDLESYISVDLFFYGLPIRREDFLLAQDLIAGMTQEEIAKDLGIAQQTVSYRIKNLRELLSKLLNLGDDGDCGAPVTR